jgi:glucokinase
MLLAGDIGATKTTLTIVSPDAGPRAPLAETTYTSRSYDSLAAIVREFLAETDASVTQAVFGVAGPVVDGRAEITNLPWIIEEPHLQQEFDLEYVRLLNDLEAMANAIPFLEPDELRAINPARPTAGAAMAIIAPGTGLGEAYLTWDGRRYRAHACEGGHTDFGPNNEIEIALLQYLRGRYGHVSYERVCSGIGLPNIYAFLRDAGHAPESDWLAARLADASDWTPIIVQAGLSDQSSCKLCRGTLDMFVSILGAEAGNLALKTMSSGGVFVAGGIPPRILPLLQDGRFMAAFTDKGRFEDLLATMPVHVVLCPRIALLGAAYCCLQEQVA